MTSLARPLNYTRVGGLGRCGVWRAVLSGDPHATELTSNPVGRAFFFGRTVVDLALRLKEKNKHPVEREEERGSVSARGRARLSRGWWAGERGNAHSVFNRHNLKLEQRGTRLKTRPLPGLKNTAVAPHFAQMPRPKEFGSA